MSLSQLDLSFYIESRVGHLSSVAFLVKKYSNQFFKIQVQSGTFEVKVSAFFLHNSTSSPFLYFVLLWNLVFMIESSCYALSLAVPKMGEESLYRCDKTYKIIALGIFKNTYFRFSNTFIYNDPRFPYSFLFSESRG